uniref:Uncharacterized protein Mb2253c family n=1 Tax=Cajanus cajan TaxID=3821 RepID=A0A151RER6_CAJCA|nr:Uncharacterized protein Mb2253c family [Cajanus cajan]
MPGIDLNFICHKLAICKEAKPISQKRRKIRGERREAAKSEMQKLLDANFIKEVKYTTWLANVVMVKSVDQHAKLVESERGILRTIESLIGADIILEGPNEMMLELAIKFDFKATNDQAQYEALLARLRLAKELGVTKFKFCSDSKLIMEQVGGSYQTKEPQLQRYNLLVSHLTSCFDNFIIEHIPRDQNIRADLLSKLVTIQRPGQHKTILQETIVVPSYDLTPILTNDLGQKDWMIDIWKYLKDEILPDDKVEASKIKTKSCHFTIEVDELFKRGFFTPLFKCLNVDQATYVMDKIHRGICGMNSRAWSMATRIIRASYYWPTMRLDCKRYVQKCKPCQEFGNLLKLPPTTLHSMLSAWLFVWWGMDILSPFPIAKGQLKFLIVGINYFTKWIEAKALAKITAVNV